MFKTKSIQFLGRTTPIILQNENGPCPLLAICNVLLLRNNLNINPDCYEVSQERLLSLVANRLIDSNSKVNNKDEGYIENQQQNFAGAINLLPRLATGIDVNIKFRRIDDFEFTPECAIFDLLDIPLYHGWIVDPQDVEAANAIGSKSYDALMDELVALETQNVEARGNQNPGEDSVDFAGATTAALGVPSPCLSKTRSFDGSPPAAAEPRRMGKGDLEEEAELLQALQLSQGQGNDSDSTNQDSAFTFSKEKEGELIRNFMKNSASQLTFCGLFRLQMGLKEGELCVFYRNNHFCTMFKHEGELYLLATDEGYLNHPDLVWEKLNEINGDTTFMTATFKEFKIDSGTCNEPDTNTTEEPSKKKKSKKKKSEAEPEIEEPAKKELVKMLVLFETPGGFALFKVRKEGRLSNVEDLGNEFSSARSARKMVRLKAFDKFDSTSEALEAVAKLLKGTPSKGLRKFLKSNCDGETLAVADSKLGNIIKEKLKIDCVTNNAVMELLRGVRNQLTALIPGLGDNDLAPMSLGLSHSLAGYKLKLSSLKVDIMIIQAIGLLDDLHKELNTYAMRLREWYGWHFPELAEIVKDNILYAKAVNLMGNRVNAAELDFSEILADDVEAKLKEACGISMGMEVSDLDLMHIRELCDQVLSLAEYRAELNDYLKSRMNTIAPNLTALVGELVGARLISHCGSLLNLSKQPGSKVQVLGTENALFKALKRGYPTPKYGLIYRSSVVGQAPPKHKGKIARSLAAKAAL